MITTSKKATKKLLRSVRIRSKKKLFWWQGPPYNAGDWVGPFLFQAITNQQPTYAQPRNYSFSTVFLTVGSVAKWIREDSVIWGSGIIKRNEIFCKPYETRAVRGPYTRDRFLELGHPCPPIYGDPAILMPVFFRPTQKIKNTIGIVAHYSNIQQVLELYSNDYDVCIIDMRKPLLEVIQAITSCEHIVSSSLHGLIFAHSYGVPAAQVKFTTKLGGDNVKFLDYYAAGGIKDTFQPLVIENKISAPKLVQYINDSPQPTLKPLIDPLLEACPFR